MPLKYLPECMTGHKTAHDFNTTVDGSLMSTRVKLKCKSHTVKKLLLNKIQSIVRQQYYVCFNDYNGLTRGKNYQSGRSIEAINECDVWVLISELV